MYYTITVDVELVNGVEVEDLHYDDMQDDPTGEYEYSIRADNEDDAMDGALEEFHVEVPIRILEHFEITPRITGRFDSFTDRGRSWRFSITGRGR